MSRKTPRVISDKQWQKMAPLFPQHPPSPKGGRPRIDDRECLEGLLWLLHSGGRWRDIPRDLPSGSTCWRRLHEWAEAGVLEKIQAVLVTELAELGRVDFSELLADATFLRAKKGATRWVTPRLARG
jgi:transposase